MARPILDDGLWQIIEPLLPPARQRRFRFPGRKPIDNRKALTGILFVLRTGIVWEDLPREMGCGCGMTCWRRLRDWTEAGVWQTLHKVLLDLPNEAVVNSLVPTWFAMLKYWPPPLPASTCPSPPRYRRLTDVPGGLPASTV